MKISISKWAIFAVTWTAFTQLQGCTPDLQDGLSQAGTQRDGTAPRVNINTDGSPDEENIPEEDAASPEVEPTIGTFSDDLDSMLASLRTSDPTQAFSGGGFDFCPTSQPNCSGSGLTAGSLSGFLGVDENSPAANPSDTQDSPSGCGVSGLPENWLSCLSAARDSQLDVCDQDIRLQCEQPLLTACVLGQSNRNEEARAIYETDSFQEFCTRLIAALADRDRDRRNPPAAPEAPPSRPPLVAAPIVRSMQVRIKTADIQGAGTDAQIKFHACKASIKSNADYMRATADQLRTRDFGCMGVQLPSGGRRLERGTLDDFSNLSISGMEAHELQTFVLDWSAAGSAPEWTIGGIEIAVTQSNGVRSPLYANACLETELNSLQKRLVLRRSDNAACVLLSVVGKRRGSMDRETRAFISFKRDSILPQSPLDKPKVLREFEHRDECSDCLNRTNSFGIPSIDQGLIAGLTGFRFDFSNLNHNTIGDTPDSSPLEARVLVFKPGSADRSCLLGAPRNLEAVACIPNSDGRIIKNQCNGLPLASDETFGFRPIQGENCTVLRNLDLHGSTARSWAGFHNTESQELQDRIFRLTR